MNNRVDITYPTYILGLANVHNSTGVYTMEDGFSLNIAKRKEDDLLTPWERQHGTGYQHYAKVYLGRTSKDEAVERARVISQALESMYIYSQWQFELMEWQFSGRRVAIHD